MIDPTQSTAIRILLVESHTETRRAMARLLSHRGFVVIDAATLAEAKEATVNQDHFNVMISDLALEDGTGLELMQWLRQKTPGLPGIALTFVGSYQDHLDAGAAGFSAYLNKPIEVDRLHQAILQYASPTQH